MITEIKKLLGYVAIYLLSIIVLIGCMPLLITRNSAFYVVKLWSKALLWGAKVFWGITVKIENADAIPEKGAIIACKHQSVLEIIALGAIVKRPIFFLKSSLLYVPFINLYLFRTRQLPVRRWVKNNSRLFGLACERLKDCNIIIFPEGTRVAVDQEKPFQSGVVVLSKQSGAPIIPVAANTGVFWPRRSLHKRAGQATLRVLEPMYVDHLRPSLERLQTRINDVSRELSEGV